MRACATACVTVSKNTPFFFSQLVVDLLISSKEPLTSFDSIKNADVREILVDNASNLDAWRGARKAVAALNLSDDVKRILGE